MKYIRTKDGRIIDCVKLINEAKKHILQNEDDYKLAHVLVSKTYDTDLGWQRRVLKTANTIKELCDEFLVFDDRKPFNEHYPFLNKNYPSGFIHAQDMVKALENKHFVIYGAIWTDKGLIYVAKMNEKGELELL